MVARPEETWIRLYPAATQTDRTIAIHGITTEAMWRDLETALGLPRYYLGRWKEWAADRPKVLTSDYDLDAAAAWAVRHKMPYEDQRALTVQPESATGRRNGKTRTGNG